MLDEQVQVTWVNYSTAQRYSGLSHVTLWRRVKRGEIKAARVGRSVRIHLPSLRAFMEERASEEAIGQQKDGPPQTSGPLDAEKEINGIGAKERIPE